MPNKTAWYCMDCGHYLGEGTHPLPCRGLDSGRCSGKAVQRSEGQTFLHLVREETDRARVKHATNIHNVAEGYAIILEELDEFWEEVRAQHGERDRDRMLKELVQIAAMAQRTAEDCGLLQI